jgi:hypothetical protein
MKEIVYLKSDKDVVDFIEKNRAQAQAEAVMGVMLWLSAESIMVEVWKN